jgi:hypothetical protein
VPEVALGQTLLKRFGDWTFPQIDGIISTPTLRRDGSILSVAGYDPATRLLLVDPPPMPPIPDEPTEQEARTALKLLLDLLTEFPFVDEASKAAALSGYITPVCRAAFPLAPMHTADAPDAASGKSYLLNTAAAIATGQDMPVLGAGGDEQELGKRLDAALMQGQPLVCLDNMTSELGGGDLCRVVEQMRVQIRVLGLTKAVTVEPRGVTFFANGISLIIRGDFVRRTIRARLDARMDRPETKVFTGNPMQKIQTNRGAYIAAALTICRAYMVAGRPGLLPQLVSFGGWSDTVRSALVWLGQTDPVRTQDVSRAEDPETGTLMTLMTAWIGSFGMGRASATTAQMVIERINCRRPVDPRNPTGDWEYVDRDLRAAVLATLPPQARGQPNAVALGIWLRGRRNKRVNGLWIGSQAATSRDPVKWWVDNEMTEQQPGPTEPIF